MICGFDDVDELSVEIDDELGVIVIGGIVAEPSMWLNRFWQWRRGSS